MSKPEEPLRVETHKQLLSGLLTAEVSSIIGLSAVSSNIHASTQLNIALGVLLASLILLLINLLGNFITSGIYYDLLRYGKYETVEDYDKDSKFMKAMSNIVRVCLLGSSVTLVIGLIMGIMALV